MIDPVVNGNDNVVEDTTSLEFEPVGVVRDEAEGSSARVKTQRRLTQARSTVSGAAIRARRSATLPSRRHAESAGDNEPSAVSTLVDRVQAYRAYILGAVAALGALIAVARNRSNAPQVNEGIDLGDWHLRADPPEAQA